MSEVHSIIFDKSWYNTTQARDWLKAHGFVPIKRVDETTNFYRYRIRDPKLFKRFTIKQVAPYIKFVFGWR